MAVKINKEIPIQSFELIRNRLAAILAEEIPAQYMFSSDPALNVEGVFIERTEGTPAERGITLNIIFDGTEPDERTSRTLKTRMKFLVVATVFGTATATDRGDKDASIKLGRLLGVVRHILSHGVYRTLAFTKPFIETTNAQEITVGKPQQKDLQWGVQGAVMVKVDAIDAPEYDARTLIQEYSTQVKLDETENGYLFSGTNIPVVPPVCPPGEVRTYAGAVIGSAPSGGFFAVPDQIFKNSDASFLVEIAAGSAAYTTPDRTYNIYVNGVLNQSFSTPSLADLNINITA
jgi:hypothetical protein